MSWIFVLLLIIAITDFSDGDGHFQRYDGWYNNPHRPSCGAAKSTLSHHAGVGYDDGVCEMVAANRSSPGLVSDKILRGTDGLPSQSNLTALFAFFGQLISAEILSTISSGEIACPPERSVLEVGHFGHCESDNENAKSCNKSTRRTLFFRAAYNRNTGQYANQPRKHINFASSWIDGSSIYGPSQFWANQIRNFVNGTIKLLDISYSNGEGTGNGYRVLHAPVTGNNHAGGSEDTPLSVFTTLFQRYHNVLAHQLQADHSDWTDEQLYQRARRFVIAALQNIIVYEYLPALLGRQLPAYELYRSYLDASITAEFQSAAFRVGHSFIPSGFFVRHRSNDSVVCRRHVFDAIPLCASSNSRPDMTMEDILRGLASQRMERSDHVFSDSVQNRLTVPSDYLISQSDLPALDIMRGRDIGLADYNNVRSAYGLGPRRTLEEINPKLLYNGSELLNRLTNTYRLDDLDLYVGGLLEISETSSIIGETFGAIILDTFQRIRDGDRFWFENRDNGLFNEGEITRIKSITLYDVILEATDIRGDEIQSNVFYDTNAACHQPYQLNATTLDLDSVCDRPRSYDFFAGSEACFIASICVLIAIPLACCLIAFIMARYKTSPNGGRRFVRGKKRMSVKRMASSRIDHAFIAEEYMDHNTTRRIQIVLDNDNQQLRTYSRDAKLLRTIDFVAMPVKVMLRLSSDMGKNCALVLHIPKEYDLVLSFDTLDNRLDFVEGLRTFLQSGIVKRNPIEVHMPLHDVMEYATPFATRRRLLESFFHTAFDQVLHAKTVQRSVLTSDHGESVNGSSMPVRMRNPVPRSLFPRFGRSLRISTHSPSTKAKWKRILLTTELNKQEFAEAFQLKPDSLFVKQMFSLADKDQNGYISYPEFIDILALLSEGTLESKMRMLFDMYDLDGSDGLDRNELTIMIRSLLDIAGDRLGDQQVEQVINGMIGPSDTESKELLSFDDFLTLIQKHQSQLADELTSRGFGFTKCEQDMNKPKRGSADSSSPVIEKSDGGSLIGRCWNRWSYYLENNWNKVFIVTVTVFVTIGLFFQKAFEYYFLKEHTGSRQITGLGVCISRGASISISFCFALLILAVCRNLMTMLRTTWLARLVPFDEAITFHRFVAYLALWFSIMHVIGHAINFYEISTQPPIVLKCTFPAIYFHDDFQFTFAYWLYGTIPGMTGVLLVVCLSVIYVFANHIARHHIYNAFYTTHRLFIPVYILTFIHGSSNFLQEPIFYLFVTGPVSLYCIDWMISAQSQSIAAKILKAEILPSDVLYLRFKPQSNSRFTYYSGQYIRIACSSISDREYHPFTITTAPHEKYMSVHIRAVGPWTRRLLSLFKGIENIDVSTPNLPKIHLDGPYGSSHQDWLKFEVVVLVGAGIGVTPHASVLKDLVQKVYHARSDITCRQVYFAWVARTHTQFEWFIDILREIEKQDEQQLARTDIFITQLMKDFDLRTMMLYICEHQFQRISNGSLFTGLRAKTHFGRPNFSQYLFSIKRRHAQVSKIGVFTCGPKTIVRSVESACSQLNQLYPDGPRIIPHHEIF